MNNAFFAGLLVNKRVFEDRVTITVAVSKPTKEDEKNREIYNISFYDPDFIKYISSDVSVPLYKYVMVQARMARQKPQEGQKHSDVNTYFVGENIILASDAKDQMLANLGPFVSSTIIRPTTKFMFSGYVNNIYSPKEGVVIFDIKVHGYNKKYFYFHCYKYVKDYEAAELFSKYRKGDAISVQGHMYQTRKEVETEGKSRSALRTFFVIDNFNLTSAQIDLVSSKDQVNARDITAPDKVGTRKKNIYGMSPDDSAMCFMGESEL